MDEVTIRLHIEPLEEGGYVATSPDVPGLVALLDTAVQALAVGALGDLGSRAAGAVPRLQELARSGGVLSGGAEEALRRIAGDGRPRNGAASQP